MKNKTVFLIVLVASVVALVSPAVVLGNSNNSLREQADKLEAKAPKDLPKRMLPKNCAVK